MVKKILFWSIIVAIVIFDQITKFLVQRTIPIDDKIEVIPGFFSLWHVTNTGAGWSLFTGQVYLLAAVSIVIIGYVV